MAAEQGERPRLAGLDLGQAGRTDETSTCELLPSKAVNASPPPWVGRWRSFTPAAFAKRAVGMWSAP
jgi:hypothetical protein